MASFLNLTTADLASRTITEQTQKPGSILNGGKLAAAQLTGTLISTVGSIFSMIISQSEADSMNEKSEREANNLKKSQEKVQKDTNSKLEQFKTQIQDAIDAINAKLDEIKDKEEEKENIQKQLAAQTDIIEEAAAYLNQSGNQDGRQGGKFKDRAEALTAISNASKEIRALASAVETLNNEAIGAQRTIDAQQLIINGAETQVSEIVEQAQQEYTSLQQNAQNQINANNSNEAKGKQAITSGNGKIDEGTATGNQQLVTAGNEEVNAGNSVINKSAESNKSVSETNGLITTDLTKLTAEKTAIGSMVNVGKSAAEQALGKWGTIGDWASNLKSELDPQIDSLDTAIEAAEAKTGTEDSEQKQNKETDGYAEFLNGRQASPFVTNKVFDYDVQNLRKVVSI